MSKQLEERFRESGLLTETEDLDPEWVRVKLREHYGIDGELRRIPTESDNTFRLHSADGRKAPDCIVKISPPEERKEIVLCQLEAIRWVQRADPEIPMPQIVPTLDGETHALLEDEAGHFRGVLRLMEFIAAPTLAEDSPTPEQFRLLGEMVGVVGRAFTGFEHPGLERYLAWDLSNFLEFDELVELEPEASRRVHARAVFQRYRERITPALPSMRRQVIHGDMSPYNLMVEPGSPTYVAGVIDFGDVMRAPSLFDPAVLMANYVQAAPQHPWTAVSEILDGYTRVQPLSAQEIALLADLTLARVALRAVMANWRAQRVPSRAEYVRSHARHDWLHLENALEFGFQEAGDYLVSALHDKKGR